MWVKNVNKLFIERGVVGDYLSPVLNILNNIMLVCVEKYIHIHNFARIFFTEFYTPILNNLSLLFTTYPHNPQHLLLTPKDKFKER